MIPKTPPKIAPDKRFQPFLVNTVVGFIGPEYLYDAYTMNGIGDRSRRQGRMRLSTTMVVMSSHGVTSRFISSEEK